MSNTPRPYPPTSNPHEQPRDPHGPVPWGSAPDGSAPYGAVPYGAVPYGSAAYGQPPRQAPVGRTRRPNPAVRVFITIVGILALVLAVGWTARTAAVGAPLWPQNELSGNESLDGVRGLVVSAESADVTIGTGSGSDLTWSATLTGDPDRLSENAVERRGDSLRISPERRNGWNFGADSGWWSSPQQRIDVQVPKRSGLDLRISAGVGEVTAEGEWSTIVADAGVGNINLETTSRSLDVNGGLGDVSGTVTIDGGAVTVDGGVGNIGLTFAGATVPESIEVNAGIGNVTLNLPPTTAGYVVTGQGGIGATSNRTPPPSESGIPVDAPVRISVDAGIGDVVLQGTPVGDV
ncbi:MAG TPA: DUF4097 family beta strand repeat-containing protein [Actinomycetaceae bacterium]|nr:DUF4097 family beta strand repeat-containing protein [Actinomycetaceae bacterium]